MRLLKKIMLLLFIPVGLYADNLASLAYLVVFWPVGLLCLIFFALFTVLLLRRLKKKHFQKTSLTLSLIFLCTTLFVLYFFIFVLMENQDGRFPGLFQMTLWPLLAGSLFPLITSSILIFKVVKHKSPSPPQE